MAADRNAVLGCAEFRGGTEPGQRTRDSLRKVHFVPSSRVQRKAQGRIWVRIELIFVEHNKGSRLKDGVRGNAELLESILAVAQIPPADVHRPGACIVKLDRVFERRVGMSEDLV